MYTCRSDPRSTARHPKIDRCIEIDWLGTPDQVFVSSCKFSFLVNFFNGFEFFLPTVPNEAAKTLLNWYR